MIERLKALTLDRPHAATWLAWLLPVFAWAPLTYPGYFELHSGFLPIFNLAGLARHLTDLSWAPVIGQPYDLLRGGRVLPYLLGMIPYAIGASGVTAMKWVFGASMMAGVLGMYAWARRRLGPWPGLLAAMVYVFWPLGLTAIYVRGALAEAVLLGLMPWALWAADRARETGRTGPAIALGLALAAALWTQAGLALWFAVLVGGYLCVVRPPGAQSAGLRGGSPLKRAGLALWGGHGGAAARTFLGWLGGLILGVLGLLPVVLRRGGGGGTWVSFTEHFVYPHQLLLAGGGAGGGMAPSIPGPADTLTFQLGLVACGLAVLGVALGKGQMANGGFAWQMADGRWQRAKGRWQRAIRNRQSAIGNPQSAIRNTQSAIPNTQSPIPNPQSPIPNPQSPIPNTQYLVIVILVLAFLTTTLSTPLWRGLPFLARTLTYPWQLLLLTGPWLAWLAGLGGRALIALLPAERRPAGAVPLIAGLIALALLGVYVDPTAGAAQILNPTPITAPMADAPVAIFGEDEIALLDTTTVGTPGPGGWVTVLARWQALRPLDRDYTVFFHVETPDGAVWGQRDTMPLDGQMPTSTWRPGQVVTDRYQVILQPDAPIADDYRYLLGLYTWQDGVRLAAGADDKVVLTP